MSHVSKSDSILIDFKIGFRWLTQMRKMELSFYRSNYFDFQKKAIVLKNGNNVVLSTIFLQKPVSTMRLRLHGARCLAIL